MRYTFLAILLTAGVFGGLLSGCCGMRHHHRHRAELEAHVADVCVSAAQRVLDEDKPER